MQISKRLFKSFLVVNLFLVGFLFQGNRLFSQSGEDLVKKMHHKYYGRWYRTFTFVQTTDIYRNDSLIRTSTWYEAAHFPYQFRIDLGDPKDGNAVIYLEDSTYRFQNHTLKSVTPGTNPFTFLLGGMYAVPLDSVLSKFKHQRYDLSKIYTTAQTVEKYLLLAQLVPRTVCATSSGSIASTIILCARSIRPMALSLMRKHRDMSS